MKLVALVSLTATFLGVVYLVLRLPPLAPQAHSIALPPARAGAPVAIALVWTPVQRAQRACLVRTVTYLWGGLTDTVSDEWGCWPMSQWPLVGACAMRQQAAQPPWNGPVREGMLGGAPGAARRACAQLHPPPVLH